MEQKSHQRWAKIGARHTQAVERFFAAANGIEAAGWNEPVSVGEWTPAQATWHLILTYDILTRELRTGTGLRIETGWLQRQFLRLMALPIIMLTRRLPSGAPAAADILPGDVSFEREQELTRLRQSITEFEAELQARREVAGQQLTHHLFGTVAAIHGLDFMAVHTDHHARQISRQYR